MAGGSGTRFWPASRKHLPKQFLPIAGELPMLTATAKRLEGLVDLDHVLVVCGKQHVELVKQCVPDLPPENLLAEPMGRNTAPCVAWAAYELQRRDPSAVQIVLPADHAIEPDDAFRRSLQAAAIEAEESSALLTLGIRPTYPATGYGYIEAGELIHEVEGHAVHAVERFVEKPDRWRAQEFVDSHTFFWNGGIFVWRTDAIVEAFEKHLPEVAQKLAGATTPAKIEEVYPTLPAQAVDVAILERVAEEERVRMVPIDYRWSDVGSWDALSDVHPLDDAKNCVSGGTKLVTEDAKNCIVWGEDGSLTALVGVEDLIVVRAGNATLVCPRDRAEDVRKIVAQLQRDHPDFV